MLPEVQFKLRFLFCLYIWDVFRLLNLGIQPCFPRLMEVLLRVRVYKLDTVFLFVILIARSELIIVAQLIGKLLGQNLDCVQLFSIINPDLEMLVSFEILTVAMLPLNSWVQKTFLPQFSTPTPDFAPPPFFSLFPSFFFFLVTVAGVEFVR